jgi:hypothetical protein
MIMSGNRRYVGKLPTDASSTSLSMVFAARISINTENTVIDDNVSSLTRYFCRIFIDLVI